MLGGPVAEPGTAPDSSLLTWELRRTVIAAVRSSDRKRCDTFPREASVDGRLREPEERALPELQAT